MLAAFGETPNTSTSASTLTGPYSCAIIWVKNIKEGSYTREQVPELSNLREVVLSLLGTEA
ncbi:hypothetical protein E1963_11555 [Extibacter muris]|uniref:Uncharacterized protein n=1 Tax=Extibacter muris TaxID=1796622 RepID=A0A4R4FCT1_9FIRM|nr:hypothetical protein E1963_11555 [Extibacter muris]